MNGNDLQSGAGGGILRQRGLKRRLRVTVGRALRRANARQRQRRPGRDHETLR